MATATKNLKAVTSTRTRTQVPLCWATKQVITPWPSIRLLPYLLVIDTHLSIFCCKLAFMCKRISGTAANACMRSLRHWRCPLPRSCGMLWSREARRSKILSHAATPRSCPESAVRRQSHHLTIHTGCSRTSGNHRPSPSSMSFR